MRARSLCSVFISMIIVGCSRPAPVPHRISFEDIIDKVHCELHAAVWNSDHVPRRAHKLARYNAPRSTWWKNWKAAVQLKIQTARDAGVSSTGNFTAPIHRGRFSLGLLGAFNKKATNSTTFNFDVYMDELVTRRVAKPKSTYRFDPIICYDLDLDQNRRGRLLAGNLGLTDWLQRAAGAYKETRTPSTGQTYFVEFVITLNGSTTPGFNITSPTGETYSVTITASGKRVRTHQLTVTLGTVPKTVVDPQLKAINEVIKAFKEQQKVQLTLLIESLETKRGREPSLAKKEPITSQIKDLKRAVENLDKDFPEISDTVTVPDRNIQQQQLLDALSRIDSNN